MSSRHILIITAGAMVILAALDVGYHGHFTDRQYRNLVEGALLKARYNTPDEKQIRATVEDRWATLDGTVETPAERLRVPDAVLRAVPGLRGVTNDIRVAGCEQRVLDSLKAYVTANPAEGEVSYTVDPPCIVTLTGWVPSLQKKDGIGAIAASVAGVREVRNKLEVRLKEKEVQEILVKILHVQNIYFDFNEARIRAESLPALDQIALLLKEQPHVRLRIEGHTDNVAETGYNEQLSRERADAVVRELVLRGVPAGRMEAVGYGETRPVARPDTPEGRAENRRIEFKAL